MNMVNIDVQKCTMCGLCVADCVRGIIVPDEKAVRVTDPEKCILCGHCKAICPVDAIELPTLAASEFIEFTDKRKKQNADDLLMFFRSRRSMRQFKETQVEQDNLAKIIEAGRFAPTGGNRQGLHYVVVNTPVHLSEVRDINIAILAEKAEEIEKAFDRQKITGQAVPIEFEVRKSYTSSWKELKNELQRGLDKLFYHAPALIVIHINPTFSTSPMIDAGLAGMQMILTAESLALGTCFCGFFTYAANESPLLKQFLQIPEEHIVALAFVVGYPSVQYRRLVARNPARVTWV